MAFTLRCEDLARESVTKGAKRPTGMTKYGAQEESTSSDAMATGSAVRVQVDLCSLQGQTGDEFDASSVTLTEP